MREKLNESEMASRDVYKTLEDKLSDNNFLATAIKNTAKEEPAATGGNAAAAPAAPTTTAAAPANDAKPATEAKKEIDPNQAVVFEKSIDLSRFDKDDTVEIVRCAEEDEDCVCKGEVFLGENNDLEDDKLSFK